MKIDGPTLESIRQLVNGGHGMIGAVSGDLGISRVTLWRALKSGECHNRTASAMIKYIRSMNVRIPIRYKPKATQRIVNACLIYFIQAGNLDIVKIGVTSNRVGLRLSHLQVSSWEELKILGSFLCERSEEHKIHMRFSKDRIRGEWFRLTGEISEFIREKCR